MFTIIHGTEYELATTLRVAYKVQGQHNHKPYAEVFKGLNEMVLEDQIRIIYASFQCANKEVAEKLKFADFLEYYLDHYNLKEVMDQLQYIVKGILGESSESEEEVPEVASDPEE